jgi:hypothetical protein
MNFKDYLKEQAEKHPSVMPQDIVKMCYQAAFGAEHLLSDIKAAEEYFNAEFLSAKENEADLYESISQDFCRVNLAAWKKLGLPKERLFEMFRMTADQKNTDAENIFSELIKTAEETAKSGEFPFSYENWRNFIEDYGKKGVRPVHHSEIYRNKEYPAYRVISSRFIPMLFGGDLRPPAK